LYICRAIYSYDIGPLLLQSKYAVPENCTAFQLRDYLAIKGSELVHNVSLTSAICTYIANDFKFYDFLFLMLKAPFQL